MKLGNQFTPGGTGFDPARDARPAVGAGYGDGTEFAKMAKRTNSMPAGQYLQLIISRLTEFEKHLVLTDESPDGWAYSAQFAQFGFVTAAMVRQPTRRSSPRRRNRCTR